MPKILVLDDDSDIASVVSMILNLNGFPSDFIVRHELLNEKLVSFSPDILILDIALGGADGRDLCKTLKTVKEFSHIHVILFSAHQDISKNFKDCDASGFVAKPFESKQLIDTINNILKN